VKVTKINLIKLSEKANKIFIVNKGIRAKAGDQTIVPDPRFQ